MVQSPESTVQSPESTVQSPESTVQSPVSAVYVQIPESAVYSPESRGMSEKYNTTEYRIQSTRVQNKEYRRVVLHVSFATNTSFKQKIPNKYLCLKISDVKKSFRLLLCYEIKKALALPVQTLLGC